ncbi:unnamed protein product [Rotaria sordida]|uniref:Uncharacterized protein n=1 Tax=Rotaria sordida TaxID=392033 RepID=A0A814JKZ6_9BILA|nr:unnamed protein product [Rotaria sordida]CAF1452098.1 unnamed protein product [Rotaria sordida]
MFYFILLLYTSSSEQIDDIIKIEDNNNSMIKSSSIRMNITNVQRLAKIESTFESILQMIEGLRRRIEQLEFNKQTIIGIS